jgi:hypothetical protein
MLPSPVDAASHTITIALVRDISVPQAELSDREITNAAGVLDQYLNHDVADAWGLPQFNVTVPISGVDVLPPASRYVWYLNIIPYSPYRDVVAWHTVMPTTNQPVGSVGLMDAANIHVSWLTVASHELAEMAVDPYATSAAIERSSLYIGGPSKVWALEVCDPVQSFTYGIRLNGVTYQMADFVYPAYFSDIGTYPFDKNHHVVAPFTPAKGGYQTSESLGHSPFFIY